MDIYDLRASTRLTNVLKGSSMESLQDIANKPANELLALRNMGIGSAQELALILMKRFYKPRWLESVAREFSFETILESEAVAQRYRSITSGFLPSEYHLLMGVIADMERGHCDYKLVLVNGAIEVYRPGDSVEEVEEAAA